MYIMDGLAFEVRLLEYDANTSKLFSKNAYNFQ